MFMTENQRCGSMMKEIQVIVCCRTADRNVIMYTYFNLFRCIKDIKASLARLYESTGRAIAITPASASALALASALASALLKMLKFLVKVFIRLYLLNMLMD